MIYCLQPHFRSVLILLVVPTCVPYFGLLEVINHNSIFLHRYRHNQNRGGGQNSVVLLTVTFLNNDSF